MLISSRVCYLVVHRMLLSSHGPPFVLFSHGPQYVLSSHVYLVLLSMAVLLVSTVCAA